MVEVMMHYFYQNKRKVTDDENINQSFLIT